MYERGQRHPGSRCPPDWTGGPRGRGTLFGTKLERQIMESLFGLELYSEWQKLNYDIYTLRQIRREVRNRWKRILEDLAPVLRTCFAMCYSICPQYQVAQAAESHGHCH
ncbi:hypothetical protein CB1_000931012 [Camelus ferus]|nr:hypothetical protein CB1_000931012 [Camelus ferus]